jgi:hypothetical protein
VIDFSLFLGNEGAKNAFVPNVPKFPKADWEQAGPAETIAAQGFRWFVPNVPNVPKEIDAPSKKDAILENDLRHELPVDRKTPQMVTTCKTCSHFARPGLSSGYCGGRDDLPLAYGVNHPLRRLPADRGASCGQWLDADQ